MAWANFTSTHARVANPGDELFLTIDTSAADLIVVGAGFYQGPGVPFPTVFYTSDSSTTGWVTLLDADSNDGNRHARSFYCLNPRQSATLGVTIHQPNPQNYLAGGAIACSGSSAYVGTQIHATVTPGSTTVVLADASGWQAPADNCLVFAVMGHDGDDPLVFDPSSGSTWATTTTNACIVAERQTAGIDGNSVGGNMSYRILGAGTSGTKFGVLFDSTGGRGNPGNAGISMFGFSMAGGATNTDPPFGAGISQPSNHYRPDIVPVQFKGPRRPARISLSDQAAHRYLDRLRSLRAA